MPTPTEDLLDRLRARYTKDGNGVQWTFVTEVQSFGGRACDALAFGMWPSHGHAIHGHELKVSRADWLRELRDMGKAEPFTSIVDYWWLVVSDKSIVRGDLPIGWGLMTPHGKGLKVVTPAARREPKEITRGMHAAIMRAIFRVSEEHYRLRYEERARANDDFEQARRDDGTLLGQTERELKAEREAIAAFEKESGVSMSQWRGADRRTAEEVGRALRRVLADTRAEENGRQRLRYLAEGADEIAKAARRVLNT